MATIFDQRTSSWKSLDYVAGWFIKAVEYGAQASAKSALVATNSICQGQQVSCLWPLIFQAGHKVCFAHTSFKWTNLATHNAGVTVVIVGLSNRSSGACELHSVGNDGELIKKSVRNINGYLIEGDNVIVTPRSKRPDDLPVMVRGNSPTDGGHLVLERDEIPQLNMTELELDQFIRPFVGSKELISGIKRFCIWIEDDSIDRAVKISGIAKRVELVRQFRSRSKKKATVGAAKWPHRFDERKPLPTSPVICVPVISSENRQYLPAGLLPKGTVLSNKVFGLVEPKVWPLAIICSRLNLMWVATVCARMRTDYSYTNTIGWNTFPIPTLTEKNKGDLTRCAEDILLAREAHFPKTIADLYDPEKMPENLRRAHDQNDEVLERIYIGRRFKNDTERLEKLFELYTKMTSSETAKEAS